LAVVGASGFVGRWLLAALRARHPDAMGTSHRGVGGLAPLDLSDPVGVVDLPWSGHVAGAILAATTNVRACEEDPQGSRRVNVEGTLRVAEVMLAAGVQPVFFSSDYVFSGAEGGYGEDAPREPSTEYGRQKVEAEDRLADLAPGALIVRLGKTFSVERGSGTLLDEMAAQLVRGEVIRAATDQVLTPIRVEDVVRAVVALVRHEAQGVRHVCGPPITRYELACQLTEAMGLPRERVEAVRLADLGLCPPRPLNTAMTPTIRLSELTKREPIPLRASLAETAAHWSA
jgi:dTDP-4-dehydrorhamnose reductase